MISYMENKEGKITDEELRYFAKKRNIGLPTDAKSDII